MRFRTGDSVKLNTDAVYVGKTIPQGTRGIVMSVNAITSSYLVAFEGDSQQRDVADTELDPA
jgi:hypothetical protein